MRMNLSHAYLLNKLVFMLFNIMLFGGVLSLAYGVVQLFRAFTNEESDPRTLSKGVGFVIGGIAMIAVKSIITTLIGTDPASIVYTS